MFFYYMFCILNFQHRKVHFINFNFCRRIISCFPVNWNIRILNIEIFAFPTRTLIKILKKIFTYSSGLFDFKAIRVSFQYKVITKLSKIVLWFSSNSAIDTKFTTGASSIGFPGFQSGQYPLQMIYF